MSTSRWGSAALAALMLVAGLGGATLLFAQPSTEDRRRAVADWLVEDVAEDDGTRVVRMTRELGDSRLEYSLAFPHGAAGPARGLSAEHLGCGGGGGIGIASVADEAPAPSVRSELGRYLARCEVPCRRRRDRASGLRSRLRPYLDLGPGGGDERLAKRGRRKL